MKQVFRPKYDVEGCLTKLRGVLESGWTGQGPLCKEFEKEFATFVGAKHALFLSSATAGLHLAMRLASLPAGSKVATTPITFVSTNAVILYENLTPVFVDVGPRTMSLDFQALKKTIEDDPEIKAVLWVHYSGSVAYDFYEFMKWRNAHRPDIFVIEDCAHAAGASYCDGSRVGSRTDTVSVFSFQAVKNCPTADSGMLVCADPEMEKRARRLAWLGISQSTFDRTGSTVGSELYKWRYEVEELGWKYNGNDIMAAIGLVQLSSLDRDNAYRHRLWEWYSQAFVHASYAEVSIIQHQVGSSVHLVAISVPAAARDRVMAEMRLCGYAPGMHYLPNDRFPAFQKWSDPERLKIAHGMSERIVTLPTHLLMTRADVNAVAHVVLKAVQGG